MSPFTIMLERDRFNHSKRSLFAMAAKHCNRVICAISNWDEPHIDTGLTRVIRMPARQSGDMACPEEVLNHKSPRGPECQARAEWAGILMDSRQDTLLFQPASRGPQMQGCDLR